MSTHAKVKLVREVPTPPKITSELRKQIADEASLQRKEMAKRIAAIESVTEEDLRIRAR